MNENVQLAYWRAKYLLNNMRGDAAEFYQIIEYSEQAHRNDPGYAPAYATEARAYDLLNDIAALPSKESTSHARAAAQRAVALDEHFPCAHVALGQVLLMVGESV